MQIADARTAKRCAIYTRKSTDERLDQELNSLEAQRDTCSSYIRSQRHKGWTELPQHYDDGGWSGSNLVRPALQQLLTDIEAGRVDVVVIYKIDRLSRSLLDFVRLIDVFERFDVSFVSITQAFDTSDSMGRLILNVLLTFAQFERELLADRIRDKMAALKRRGKYTGGRPPFGYDKVDKRLVVRASEAEIVRQIYDRYLTASSGFQLLQQLRAEGIRNKTRLTATGKTEGGHLMGPGILHRILTNPIYLGKIDHDGQWFDGEHEAIITREQWDAVQARRALRHECQIPRRPTGAMLKGVLHDTHGRRMHPDVIERRGKRFSYYATELSREGKRQKLRVVRVGADEVESLTVAAFRSFLSNRPAVSEALVSLGSYDAQTTGWLKAAPRMSKVLGSIDPVAIRSVVQTVVLRAELSRERLVLMISCVELSRLLDWDGVGLFKPGGQVPSRLAARVYRLDVPAAIVREDRQICLPLPTASEAAHGLVDPRLVNTIFEARAAQALVYANRDKSLSELARSRGYGPALFSRLVRLNYLAPDIVAAIIDGHQTAGITRSSLLRAALPLDWAHQRILLGFPPRRDEGGTISQTARNHAPRTGGLASL